MSEIQLLVERVDALATLTGTSPSTLSRKLFGNGKRIDQIRAGGTLTLATFERAKALLNAMESTPNKEKSAA